MFTATEEQRAVIEAVEKHLLVIACPGSGKTATLVERCRYLPSYESKLVLAFNKGATEEFLKRLDNSVSNCLVQSFHAFCLRQIRKFPQSFGYTKSPTVDTETSLFHFMNEANGTDYHSWDESPWDDATIRNYQHSCYNDKLVEHSLKKPTIPWGELLEVKVKFLIDNNLYDKHFDGDQIKNGTDVDWPVEIVELEDELREYGSAHGLLKLRSFLQSSNIVTFDEMVRVVAECRDYIDYPVDHIMIDEFQDVDRFQFDIIHALGDQRDVKTIACVGDPNQLVYAWRGALRDSFESFEGIFPECRTFPMTINFRSVDAIIKEAEKVISVGMKGVRGDVPGAVRFITREGAQVLYQDLNHSNYCEAAILCRYNREVAMWSIRLAKSGIPVHVIGKLDFWAYEHVKIAEAGRIRGWDFTVLQASPEWSKLMKNKKYRRSEEATNEAMEDAKFVLDLTREDYALIKKTYQSKDGLVISTLHRTKGKEWSKVLISGIDEKLQREKTLFYVGITRAKDLLLLG
jgi:superfamily I DNA/RNA helicase